MAAAPSKTALARELGISRPQLYRLIHRGMPVHSVEAARAWRREQQPDSGEESTTITAQTMRLRAAQADLAELEAAEKRGELCALDDAEIAANEALVIVGTQLEALPGRCAAMLAGMTDAAEIRAYLLHEVRAIRGAAAARLEDWARMAQGGAAPEAAARSDAGRVGGSVSDPAAGES